MPVQTTIPRGHCGRLIANTRRPKDEKTMIVFVRYNLGPGVALELQEESSVAELKEVVGSQQGVRPERLRVLFAGRELRSSATLQSCDLPEQSTVHVVLPPSNPSSSSQHLLLAEGEEEEEEEQDSLTRLDLSHSLIPSTSSGLLQAASHPRSLEGRNREGTEEAQSAGPDGQSVLQKSVKRSALGVQVCPGVQRVSTFFVYCKKCRSIQRGKLRVRCRSCKQTTLTLSKGPSCWDDVHLQGRISGVCQSDGCHGNEAEFYMKCGSHPTTEDEVSVALDLIMTNRRDVPCLACTDTSDVILVFPCSQRHVICLDCFCRYCQSRLNERQFVFHPVIGYSLPCAAGCDESLIKELHHFRILGEEQYDRYLQYGAEQCLLMTGGLLCPSPGCGAGLVPPDDSRRVECDQLLGCGFIFCRDCKEAYHEGACLNEQALPTYGETQGFMVDEEASVRGRWEQASLLLVQESTKPCPQCSVPVERNGGCMHMHCPLCRAEWCWICGITWNTDCMGDHWFG